MKFQLDKKAKETLDRILELNALSQEASDLLSSFLNDAFDGIDFSLLQRLRKELSCSLEQAYYPAFLSVLDLDPEDPELKKIEKATNIRDMTPLDEERFLSNPYLRSIRFPNRKEGKWSLTKNYYLPYEAFLFDETKARREDLYLPKDSLGYFRKQVDYPLVEEKDHVWMSVTPYEINTMQKSIEKSHGKVLALGLGLGYFPFMALRRKEVESVVVVEKDKKVISLFEKFILPQFPKKSFTIVEEDAYAYLKKGEAESYDTYFFDTHSTPEDAVLPYIQYLSFQKRIRNKTSSFWIEASTIVYLRRILLALIQEEWDGAYEKGNGKDFADKLVDSFHNQLEDKILSTSDDVLDLLDDRSLKDLLCKIKNS